ncbi:enolase C-terminal domain-like protein [Streptomyces sp. FXJ1.4098]|nr:enolase C-terminal domain-like protein [Streptomyces sp. FXJ1.4098]
MRRRGLTQMVKIATVADAHYVPVAPHNPLGPLATAANVHFAAATTNFDILEYKPDDVSWCPTPTSPSMDTSSCARTARLGRRDRRGRAQDRRLGRLEKEGAGTP